MFVTPLTEELLASIDESQQGSFDLLYSANPCNENWWNQLSCAVAKYEAWCVLEDHTDCNILAIAAASNEINAITLLSTREGSAKSGAVTMLSETLIKQLDPKCEMVVLAEENDSWMQVVVPPNPDKVRGASFHYSYQRYMRWSEPAQCPVCLSLPGPSDIVTISDLPHSWVEATIHAQGGLYGKCHVLCKEHFVELFDMDESSLLGFMTDVQTAARALKHVSGAVKINYEIHGNSMPHLHAHLFPRYVDDPFPSAPIDYRITKPPAYTDQQDFDNFVEAMRREIDRR